MPEKSLHFGAHTLGNYFAPGKVRNVSFNNGCS